MPDETITLLHKEYGESEDEIGDFELEWVEIAVLEGVIQGESYTTSERRGAEEDPIYTGYFYSNFTIPFDKTGEYRIMHIIPTTTPQIILYEIKEIDRNLELLGKQHHMKLTLGVDRKHGSGL